MENNKNMVWLCDLLAVLFAALLAGLIFCRKRGIGTPMQIFLTAAALAGCGFALILRDCCRSMIQSAGFDVAGVHDKKSLEKYLQKLQDADDTLDIGIMMFDLNNLKVINDTYGHEQGDIFINTFASFLTRILTEDSYLARFGGDEFVIVQKKAAWSQLEQMNIRLQNMIDDYNQKADHPLSYAVGYDISCKNHYYLVMDLLQIADQKMYQDKKYKKELQKNKKPQDRSEDIQSISQESLREKLHTILTNGNGEKTYAFLMTDVSEFHLINEYWGYETGTKILKAVLKRLELFPGTIFVKRYYSDIFTSVIDITESDKEKVQEQIVRYNEEITKEILAAYPMNYFSLNTGIFFIENTEIPSEEIIASTNLVRRKARQELRGVCTYSQDIADRENRRADTIHSFQKAVEQEEFKIYFQPKISGETQQIASAEVLVRWQREPGVVWAPDMFLPFLEQTGEIEALDFYVYEKAFQWLDGRRRRGLPMLPLSLNVSPVHFRKIQAFTSRVMELIRKYQIDSRYLILEITETSFINNIDAVNQMIRFFHQHDIRISMDDFGSGYSSLNTLKDILFDEVKIDKRFLDDDLTENGRIVLQEIFHLLKRTKKAIVCEGVETKDMVDFLVAEGCDELQGYYYYKPMCEEDFEKIF